MRKNQRHALDALFNGKDLNLPSLIVDQNGGDNGEPTIYSYGYHYPLLLLSQDHQEAYLNTAKYSATTTSQQSGCKMYLRFEGYRDTGQIITHRGHTFAVYQLTEPESWPGGHYSGTYDRPAHHTKQDARYSGPVYHADSRTYGPRKDS